MALAYSYRRVSSGGQAQGDKSGLQRQGWFGQRCSRCRGLEH